MSTAVMIRAWSILVPHRPQGARSARQRVAAALAGLVSPRLVADCMTVVTELVANAVRHARPLPGNVIRVAWRLVGEAVEVRITDGGSADRPAVRPPKADATSGRGLAIVAGLAIRWGVDSEPDGPRTVWAVMA